MGWSWNEESWQSLRFSSRVLRPCRADTEDEGSLKWAQGGCQWRGGSESLSSPLPLSLPPSLPSCLPPSLPPSFRCPGWGSAHCEPSSNTIWTQQLILIGCEYAFPSPWTLSTPRPLPTSFSPFLLFPKCCTPRRNIKNIFVNWKTYGNFAKQGCLWISNFLAN